MSRSFVPMTMKARRLLVLIAVALATAVPARAGETYSEPTFGVPWDTTTLEILIDPPPHGQLVNGNGVLAGYRTSELDRYGNTYLRAVENSIQSWRKAIAAYAPTYLSKRLRIRTYVIGRDQIPRSALEDPEGLITTMPHQAHAVGLTAHGSARGVKCVITNARFFLASFTYEDMFSVNAHEFGHCLGIDHVVEDRPAHDLMTSVYEHEVGARGTHRHCPSNLNVRTITRAFGEIFDKPATGTVRIAARDYRRIRC